jgi:hypothetical protein
MTPGEQLRANAMLACLERGKAIFPPLAADDPAGVESEGRSDFRILSSGQFAMEVSAGSAPPPEDQFACTGDLNGRTITSLQWNGSIRRPAPGEVWSF